MMKYVVESFYDDAKVTVETNDPEVAVLEMIRRDMDEVHAHCLSGETGEILAIVNCPSGENYSTPEFALMTLGVLMAHQWGEDDEPEEVEPLCQMCGGEIYEGTCLWCGVVDETKLVNKPASTLDLVDKLAESCSAIKCKICGLPS